MCTASEIKNIIIKKIIPPLNDSNMETMDRITHVSLIVQDVLMKHMSFVSITIHSLTLVSCDA